MKIVFVIESLEMGGSEKSLVALLQNLNFEGHDVELMLIQDGGFFREQIPQQIKVSTITNLKYSLSQRILFKLRKVFNHHQLHSSQLFWKTFSHNFPNVEAEYDVAVSYSQGFCTYFTAEKINAKRKLTWNNVDFLAAGYQPKFDSNYYAVFDRIILVSKFVKEQFSKVPQFKKFMPKTEVVYDITDYEKVIQWSESIEDLFKFPGFKILTVGRMEFEKGFDLAVETVKILKDKGLQFKWFFVGDGNERGKIEGLIRTFELQDFVQLLGKRKNPYEFMKQCDLYVQPSRYEGWGLTLVEAKILGKAVVSTNFPTAYEILDEENGIIAEMNPVSLAEKIEMVIKNDSLRNKFSVDIVDEVMARKEQTISRVWNLVTNKKL